MTNRGEKRGDSALLGEKAVSAWRAFLPPPLRIPSTLPGSCLIYSLACLPRGAWEVGEQREVIFGSK